MFVCHCVVSVHVMRIEMKQEMIGRYATYALVARPVDLAGKRYTEQRL